MIVSTRGERPSGLIPLRRIRAQTRFTVLGKSEVGVPDGLRRKDRRADGEAEGKVPFVAISE